MISHSLTIALALVAAYAILWCGCMKLQDFLPNPVKCPCGGLDSRWGIIGRKIERIVMELDVSKSYAREAMVTSLAMLVLFLLPFLTAVILYLVCKQESHKRHCLVYILGKFEDREEEKK